MIEYSNQAAASEIYSDLPESMQKKFSRSDISDILGFLMEAEDMVDDPDDINQLLQYIHEEVEGTVDKKGKITKKELEILMAANENYIDLLGAVDDDNDDEDYEEEK